VYRPNTYDTQGDDDVSTNDLATRWEQLQDGATVGALLTRLARDGHTDRVHVAIANLDRDQLEAATLAMVLIHADNAPMLDTDQ
jgi:hypothetical protein